MSGVEEKLTLDQYDQSKFSGRLRHFLALVNPLQLFVSEQKLAESKALLDQFKTGTLAPGVTNEELWKANTIISATCHPDTGEVVPLPFRMSAFMPMNIPIACGMLLSPATLFNAGFWQWVNQSFNAGFNFANRNASSPTTTESMLTGYAAASISSCGVAVGLTTALERATLGPAARALLQRTVPYSAVVSASVLNLYLMRRSETTEGVDVIDHEGVQHGLSPTAGKMALMQSSITRMVLPLPVLLVPPLVMACLDASSLFKRNPRLRLPAQIAVISASIWGALPAAVALFPQRAEVSVSELEPEFQKLVDSKGEPIRTLYYNKGV